MAVPVAPEFAEILMSVGVEAEELLRQGLYHTLIVEGDFSLHHTSIHIILSQSTSHAHRHQNQKLHPQKSLH